MPLSHLYADDVRALRRGTAGLAMGPERERVVRLAERASRSTLPVLVESEPGSGAQALARAIHDCSERRGRPFVRVDAEDLACRGDDPAPILAKALKSANGGTLLLQDVDRLSGKAQATLLEALHPQDPALRGMRRQDVRLTAIAGPDLSQKVRDGRFREDLFYRLQTLPIALRPLRAQREAIPEWARLFMSRFAAEEGKRIRDLSAEAAALLGRYEWPGNLRQLENVVYRAVILAEGSCLTPAEFPQIAAHVRGFRVEIPPVPTVRMLAPVREAAPAARDPQALPLLCETGDMRTLADLEAQAIRFALVHYQGHMSAISRHLGIGRSTLYRKLKELGLDDAAA